MKTPRKKCVLCTIRVFPGRQSMQEAVEVMQRIEAAAVVMSGWEDAEAKQGLDDEATRLFMHLKILQSIYRLSFILQ